MAYQEAIATEDHRAVAEIEATWFDRIRAEGREEGLARGLERGLEQGLEQGRCEALREMTLGILEERFGAVPRELRGRVVAVEAEDVLSEFARRAATVENLEDFSRRIPE